MHEGARRAGERNARGQRRRCRTSAFAHRSCLRTQQKNVLLNMDIANIG